MRSAAIVAGLLALVGASASAGAVGSQLWHLTDTDPPCGLEPGEAEALRVFQMARGGAVGTENIEIIPNKNVTFCAEEAALVNVLFSGNFSAEVVFGQFHPLPDPAYPALCEGVETRVASVEHDAASLIDHFTLRVGVWDPESKNFTPKSEVKRVHACQLVEVAPLELAAGGHPLLWSTGVQSFPGKEVFVPKGDYLAFQIEQFAPQLPAGATFMGRIVTLPVGGTPIDGSSGGSPSVMQSPDQDPGYPVPEWDSLFLVGSGLAVMALVLRRR